MPITPVPEKPPVKRSRNSIDWTEALDALTDNPGEWFKVDGPCKSNATQGRERSLTRFAAAQGVTVEVTHRGVGGEQWIYARITDNHAEAEPPAPKPKPVAAVPDPPAKPPSPNGDFGGDHECDTCDAKFRTNTRLRQHQANAHKAS